MRFCLRAALGTGVALGVAFGAGDAREVAGDARDVAGDGFIETAGETCFLSGGGGALGRSTICAAGDSIDRGDACLGMTVIEEGCE